MLKLKLPDIQYYPYAHPLFWAPYALVCGSGRQARHAVTLLHADALDARQQEMTDGN